MAGGGLVSGRVVPNPTKNWVGAARPTRHFTARRELDPKGDNDDDDLLTEYPENLDSTPQDFATLIAEQD